MGQPAKEKTLQDFKDEVARRDGYESWNTMIPPLSWAGLFIKTEEAAERYATYKEQRAKEAAFDEGKRACSVVWESDGSAEVSDPINPYKNKDI